MRKLPFDHGCHFWKKVAPAKWRVKVLYHLALPPQTRNYSRSSCYQRMGCWSEWEVAQELWFSSASSAVNNTDSSGIKDERNELLRGKWMRQWIIIFFTTSHFNIIDSTTRNGSCYCRPFVSNLSLKSSQSLVLGDWPTLLLSIHQDPMRLSLLSALFRCAAGKMGGNAMPFITHLLM